jgi:hypothetical protein
MREPLNPSAMNYADSLANLVAAAVESHPPHVAARLRQAIAQGQTSTTREHGHLLVRVAGIVLVDVEELQLGAPPQWN